MVRTGVPAWPPGELHSVATLRPAAFTTTTEVVGVPISSFWKVCSNPVSPTVMPGWYAAPSSRSSFEFSVPTWPTTSWAEELNSRSACCWWLSPGTLESFGHSDP